MDSNIDMISHVMHNTDISNILLFQLNNDLFFVPQNTMTPSTPKHISLQAISCLNRPPQTKILCTNVLVKLFNYNILSPFPRLAILAPTPNYTSHMHAHLLKTNYQQMIPCQGAKWSNNGQGITTYVI